MTRGGGEGGVLPMMDYTGMLRPKGVLFWELVICERAPFFRLEVCERGTFSKKGV